MLAQYQYSEPCPEGYYCPANMLEAVPCPKGYYAAGGTGYSDESTGCIEVGTVAGTEGLYVDEPGMTLALI